MKVLITGGMGFIGSYAIEKFSKEGWTIDVIDNYSTNAIESDPRINKLYKMGCFEFDDNYDQSYNLIVHLASKVGPVGVLLWSGEMAGEIIADMEWAKNLALKNDCPLVFISTSEVYGKKENSEPLKETDDKVLGGEYTVRQEYAFGKLLAEIALVNTAKVKPLKYRIIRPFNVSGPRQQSKGGFVIPKFVQAALKNEPLTVFNDGKDIRSFTSCFDIVEGIFLLAHHTENGIWNIGTHLNRSTILDLAKLVIKLSGSKSEIVFVDPKTIHGPLFDNAYDKVANSEKISKLGWKHTHSIEDIVRDTIEYWRKNEK